MKEYNLNNITKYVISKGAFTNEEGSYLFEKFRVAKASGVDDNLNLYRTLLITGYFGVIKYVISKFFHGIHGDDYIQIGLIGLIKGIDSYAPSKTVLTTYLTHCVYNEIGSYLRVQNKKIKPDSLEEMFDYYDDGCFVDNLKDPDDFCEEILENEKINTMLKFLTHFN